jgi:hypothetical protein
MLMVLAGGLMGLSAVITTCRPEGSSVVIAMPTPSPSGPPYGDRELVRYYVNAIASTVCRIRGDGRGNLRLVGQRCCPLGASHSGQRPGDRNGWVRRRARPDLVDIAASGSDPGARGSPSAQLGSVLVENGVPIGSRTRGTAN